ncbi:MAG: hypothetical protein RSK76_05980 [Clostridia bacterium]
MRVTSLCLSKSPHRTGLTKEGGPLLSNAEFTKLMIAGGLKRLLEITPIIGEDVDIAHWRDGLLALCRYMQANLYLH